MTATEIVVVVVLLGGPMAAVTIWSLRFRTAVVLAALILISLRLIALFATEEDIRGVSERPLYKAGQDLEDAVERSLPRDPKYRNDFLAQQLPEAIGEVLAVVIMAVLLGFLYWVPSAVRRRIRGAPS